MKTGLIFFSASVLTAMSFTYSNVITGFNCKITYERNKCGFYGSADKVYIENTDSHNTYLVTYQESNSANNETHYYKEKVSAGETTSIGCTQTGSQGSATIYYKITGEQKASD